MATRIILSPFAVLVLAFVFSPRAFSDEMIFRQSVVTSPVASGGTSSQVVDAAAFAGGAGYGNFLWDLIDVGYLFTLSGSQPEGSSSNVSGATVRAFRSYGPQSGTGIISSLDWKFSVTRPEFCNATTLTTFPAQIPGRPEIRPVLVVFANPCPSVFQNPRLVTAQVYGVEAVDPIIDEYVTVDYFNTFDEFKNIRETAVYPVTQNSGLIFGVNPNATRVGVFRYLGPNVLPELVSWPLGLSLTQPRVVDVKFTSNVSPGRKLAVVSSHRLTLLDFDTVGNLTLDSDLTSAQLPCLLGINGVSLTSNVNQLFVSSVHPVNGGAIYRLTRGAVGQPWSCGSVYKDSRWTTAAKIPQLSEDSPFPDKNLVISIRGTGTGTNEIQLVEWNGVGFSVRNQYFGGVLSSPMKAVSGLFRVLIPNGETGTGFTTYQIHREFRDGFE